MSTLFISDLHLEDGRPDALGWLMAFLEGPAHAADALYILGDLFEYWIGDDAVPACARQLAGATSRLAEEGLPVYFMHGNRDFLLGQAYAQTAGFELLPETVVMDLHGTPTLLLHGDSLCTDDAEYQAFRLQARNPAWQAAVLARSVEERAAMARNARDASMQHTSAASMDIMDVNQEAVRAAFKSHGVNRMIHGHTHRPAIHEYDLDASGTARRIVLADWYRKGSYLEVSESGAVSKEL